MPDGDSDPEDEDVVLVEADGAVFADGWHTHF
jgi:hypothetical protein